MSAPRILGLHLGRRYYVRGGAAGPSPTRPHLPLAERFTNGIIFRISHRRLGVAYLVCWREPQ